VVDEKLRNTAPSLDKIFFVIEQGLREKIGPDIEISTREVKKISKQEPRVVTKINRDKFKVTGYV